MTTRLSIIVPTLDEEAAIGRTLACLRPALRRGAELVVVDGGSRDATLAMARAAGARTITAPRGRATQMNAGARAASGDMLLFLHADTLVPPDFDAAILAHAGAPGDAWGRFDVRIEGRHPLLPVVAALMNLRSRLTGIATGDQAIFVGRGLFDAAGGFPDLPLMEDVALSTSLRRRRRPRCLRERVLTSGRRWERRGVLRTIVLMWRLRLAWFFGADAAILAARYGRER